MAAGHRRPDPAWGRADGFPSFSAERSTCALASAIHRDASGSPTVPRSQLRSARPSPRLSPKLAACGARAFRERAWVVVGGPQGIGNNLRDSLGVFLVAQQVGSDARRPRDRHPVKNDPLVGPGRPVVKPDVRAAGLPPLRQRELVPVCGQVAKTVQHRGRTVGYDPLLRCPLPRRNLGSELQPRRTKFEVIRQRRPGQAVHAVRYPVKDARLGESLQRSLETIPAPSAWRRVMSPHWSSAIRAMRLRVEYRATTAL